MLSRNSFPLSLSLSHGGGCRKNPRRPNKEAPSPVRGRVGVGRAAEGRARNHAPQAALRGFAAPPPRPSPSQGRGSVYQLALPTKGFYDTLGGERGPSSKAAKALDFGTVSADCEAAVLIASFLSSSCLPESAAHRVAARCGNRSMPGPGAWGSASGRSGRDSLPADPGLPSSRRRPDKAPHGFSGCHLRTGPGTAPGHGVDSAVAYTSAPETPRAATSDDCSRPGAGFHRQIPCDSRVA